MEYDVRRPTALRARVGVCAVGCATCAATGQTPIDWAAPASGAWFDATNWSTMQVPGLPDRLVDARLSAVGTYTVTLQGTTVPERFLGLQKVSVLAPGATLEIGSDQLLEVFDDITNNGTMRLGQPAGAATAALNIFGGTISGTGRLVLDDASGPVQLGSSPALSGDTSFTNSAHHTIAGSGQIRSEVDNAGVIEADVPGRGILLAPETGAVVNTGLIRAAAGARIELGGVLISNEPPGVLRADGGEILVPAGGFVFFFGGGVMETINGGALRVANGGLAFVLSDGATGSPTLEGDTHIDGGGTLTLDSSVVLAAPINNGTITVNADASALTAMLGVAGDASLRGAGEALLQAGAGEALVLVDPGATLTNGAAHTIRGHGRVDGTVHNLGAILGDTLRVQNADITDQAIQAQGGEGSSRPGTRSR